MLPRYVDALGSKCMLDQNGNVVLVCVDTLEDIISQFETSSCTQREKGLFHKRCDGF